jgi:hypothetical protein
MRHRSAGGTASPGDWIVRTADIFPMTGVNPNAPLPTNDARVNHVGPTRTAARFHVPEPRPESRWGGVPGAPSSRSIEGSHGRNVSPVYGFLLSPPAFRALLALQAPQGAYLLTPATSD